MSVEPVAGPRFRLAAKVPLKGKTRRLLVLIAAYQDAGHEPSVRELIRRGNFNHVWDVDRILVKLERAKLLRIERKPQHLNRYTLMVDRAALGRIRQSR